MKNDRLLSLDVLRGVDLFMLVALQPILRGILLTIANSLILFFILRLLYKHKIFLKV